MNLSIGIVGLPNVGKSTLFNALLKKQQAFVANYPFATIEPNVGVVLVPDERLIKLAEITKEEHKMPQIPPIIPAAVSFVDIAGLVKGASQGEGLGNKFLSHIREVNAIVHVVRSFEDENVLREGSVGPKEDYLTIQTELILADLATISKIKDLKSKIQIKGQKEMAEKLFEALNKGIPARDVALNKEEQEIAKQFFLLTAKPEIIVLNIEESDYKENKINPIVSQYTSILGVEKERVIVVSAKIEAELAELSEEEQVQYLKELGVEQSGLERVIKEGYKILNLISYLTCGEKEVRAWTIRKGSTALISAGEIHTDFMKRFIKAEVVHFPDFVEFNGWKGAREHGKALLEGKDYIMKDGDVVEFKIGS